MHKSLIFAETKHHKAMETKAKGLPYGVASFEEVRKGNFYYVDKTKYLPLLEDTANYLFLIRPRRFGKSLFVSMMRAYYDLSMAGRFDELFGGLWIHEHPTELKNSFQLIYFDFSLIGGRDEEELENNFNKHCCAELNNFIKKYKAYYDEDTYTRVLSEENAFGKFQYIHVEARTKGYRLYLIIDEYDNFTNTILSEGGKEMFRKLTHASGFYRYYFKIFKAMFSRVFLIGVSPVTLDDLSSGYNIDWNISQDPRFNDNRLEHLAGSALQRHAGIFGNGCPRHVRLLPASREASGGRGHRSHDGGDEAVVQQLLLLQKTH